MGLTDLFVLGLRKFGFSVSITLGSGYSVENDIETRKQNLKRVCDTTVAIPALKSIKNPDGVTWKTFCNVGTQMICESMDVKFFNHEMANQMYDLMATSPKWRKDSGLRAHLHANNGMIAVAAQKHDEHGHVTVIYPAPKMEESGSWGEEVPFCANIGAHPKKREDEGKNMNSVCRVSQAFLTEPDYFLFVGDEA